MNNITEEYKLIDWRLYDPTNSLFFKAKANEKSSFKKVYCKNSDNCDLYKKGSCVLSDVSGTCPYGKINRLTGYSKRAKKFHSFLSESREVVKDIKQLSSPSKKMCQIDEYVFFPYSHWSLDNKSLPEKLKTGYFSSDNKVIPFDIFKDPEFLNSVFSHRPQALFGGTITSYFEEVKLMKQHLYEEFPDVYNLLIEKHPEYKIAEINAVGRKAYVNTLKPGCEIHLKFYGDFTWDGEKLISKNFRTSLFPIKGEFNTVEFIPDNNSSFEVTSNDQVYEKTKFVN